MLVTHRIGEVDISNYGKCIDTVVSIGDVVRNRVGEMESENQALRNYVSS